MRRDEQMWHLSQHSVINLYRRFVILCHSNWNSGQAQSCGDGHFRHQPWAEVDGVNNNKTANGRACQVAFKCHFHPMNHHITKRAFIDYLLCQES